MQQVEQSDPNCGPSSDSAFKRITPWSRFSQRVKAKLKAIATFRANFGTVRMLEHAAFRFINQFCHFDCLHIIALDRANLRPLDPAATATLSAKPATWAELEEMKKQGCWGMTEEKLAYFEQGDTCLLSYVGDEMAGYTWTCGTGRASLVTGLTVSVPDEYLYNFGAFTHPDFRGYGLQSFRHHALLNDPRWKDRKGLLGFVVHTNVRSKRGQ